MFRNLHRDSHLGKTQLQQGWDIQPQAFLPSSVVGGPFVAELPSVAVAFVVASIEHPHENVRRKDLLVFKLTERTGLVDHGINIGFMLH